MTSNDAGEGAGAPVRIEPAARIGSTSALEQHAQTILASLVGAALLWGAANLNGLLRDVASLAADVRAAKEAATIEAARRDQAITSLATTVAQHDRQLADLAARQAADEREAARAASALRRRPGDGGGSP